MRATDSGAMVPMCDISAEVSELREELASAMTRVLDSCQYILGPEVKAFEKEFANYLGVTHAIGVNSGTDALVIALRALDISTGDEVIVPSFTFFATAEAVSAVGATPVFVDIDPVSFTMVPARVKEAVTNRTRAIIPVHLYGHAADMTSILRIAEDHELSIVEDVAQACGGEWEERKLGALGSANAFSFFPSKNLGAAGDGGLITTDDDEVAEMARALRAHGARTKYHNEYLGYNSRLDELHAAMLRVKLSRLETNNQRRREAADRYRTLLADCEFIVTPSEAPSATHVYHQYTLRVLEGLREKVSSTLREAGISTFVYYPTPIHRLPAYAPSAATLPNTDKACQEVLSLPMWPQISSSLQERIAEVLRRSLD